MKEIVKIKFNWRQTIWDGEAGEDYEVYTKGEKGVTDIIENETQCYHYTFWYIVKFEDNSEQKIFNPNQVFYK